MAVARTQHNYILLLVDKLKSIASDLLQTSLEYYSLAINPHKTDSQRYALFLFFARIIRYLWRTFTNILRTLYWLMAPNMLFKLCVRHYLLFLIMFTIPPVVRSMVLPIWKWCRYHIFLRLVMGREWVSSYRAIKSAAYNDCSSYSEYGELCTKLDDMDGLDAWRINKFSTKYSHNRLHQDLMALNRLRRKCEGYTGGALSNAHALSAVGVPSTATHPMRELMQFLRSRIERNYCGITDPQLYTVTKIGTKKLIEDFRENVIQSLEYIAHHEDDALSNSERIVFFNEMRHVLGRTALCLSGGGGLGAYHVGIVLALQRNQLLPKIFTGSSVGSVVASLVCTKPDEELDDLTADGVLNLTYFDKKQGRRWIEGAYVRLRRFWQTGYFLDVTVLRNCVRDNIGDITFLEAYTKTGRILNITVSGTDANTMPRLLNFLTAPNVVVWSAVAASCAIPFVYEPQELYCKTPGSNKVEPIYLQGVTFSDGSVSHDLPMNKLSQLFNVDNFVVSQVNPHLVPFLWHSIVAPIPGFDKVIKFLSDEFHLYLTSVLVNLRELGLLKGIAIFNEILTQRYTGDVTIVPDIPLSDYMAILSNPTLSYINRCSDQSERSTWKHISRLQGLCATEFTIDQCLNDLRLQINRNTSSSLGKAMNRISSFQAPNTGNKATDQHYSHYNNLHIPQTIYSSILSNTNEHQLFQFQDPQSMRTAPNSEALLEESAEVMPGPEDGPRLKNVRSEEIPVLQQLQDSGSTQSLHKSMSVADLCSDLSNIL